jgi:WXXGXW repeat (2 copies)
MKNRILALTLLTVGGFFGQVAFGQISLGIRIGPPPAPRVVAVRPVAPGPDYAWVDGYWYPEGGRYRWHAGYWSRPPYTGAHWVGPHHDGERFYAGYWDGGRGRFEHDHHWDNDRDRDYHRGEDRH